MGHRWGQGEDDASRSALRARAGARSPFSGFAWRILFSRKDDWEPVLREAFVATRHAVTFGVLDPISVRAHDVVVPLTIADLEWMAAAPELVTNNPLPIPDLRSLGLCNDKLAFNQALLDLGFSVFVPNFGRQQFFPYIIKKRVDEWGAHSHVVGSWNHERRYAALLEDPAYFCQEFVHGRYEYATHVLFDGERVLHHVTIRYEFGDALPIKGRSFIVGTARVEDPGCVHRFAGVLAAIGFRGMCCVNYKLDDTLPRIFEINPRPGASVCPHLPEFLHALAAPLARAATWALPAAPAWRNRLRWPGADPAA